MGQSVLFPFWRNQVERRLCINLVNEHIASMATFHDGLGWFGVAGNNNRPIWSLKAVAICLQLSVRDRKGLHRYVLVLVNDAGFNLVHIDFVSALIGVL